MSRWATFDCYGTLIDWNAGIGAVLEHLFGAERAPALLERYHGSSPRCRPRRTAATPRCSSLTLERLAAEAGCRSPRATPARSRARCPTGRRFREVPAALAELRRRGWSLAILSNTDHALITESQKALGVPIDVIVTAEDVHSYKPAHGHWERFFELTTADKARHVHVGASLFHDIAPARELGLTTVWINRLGEQADPEPDRGAARPLRRCRTRSTSSFRRERPASPREADLDAVLECCARPTPPWRATRTGPRATSPTNGPTRPRARRLGGRARRPSRLRELRGQERRLAGRRLRPSGAPRAAASAASSSG